MEYELKTRLLSGGLDASLDVLYGAGRREAAAARCLHVLDGFERAFCAAPTAFFSAPGRTEMGGNHTDHQHGRVLAASVDLDVLAAAAKTDTGVLRILSEGYPMIQVDLADLAPRPEEENTSAALVRGVAARFRELGCSLAGVGLDAYVISDVPGGSGLSSSAAFEVLLGVMVNELFFGGRCDPVQIAQIGQWAENVYFGKPCGLMDQMASSVGGVVAIDFLDPERPVVERIDLDLQRAGFSLCILDSGAGHGDLTAEYAAITDELRAVSAYFGKSVLREVREAEFTAAIPALRERAGDRAVLRAMHYFDENERAAQQADALRAGDFDRFLALTAASGRSSALFLQNVIPTGQTNHQALMIAIALAGHILSGRGAVRVHGGGFGGTAQAWVPLDILADFKTRTEAVLGAGACRVLSIRPVGGTMFQ